MSATSDQPEIQALIDEMGAHILGASQLVHRTYSAGSRSQDQRIAFLSTLEALNDFNTRWLLVLGSISDSAVGVTLTSKER